MRTNHYNFHFCRQRTNIPPFHGYCTYRNVLQSIPCNASLSAALLTRCCPYMFMWKQQWCQEKAAVKLAALRYNSNRLNKSSSETGESQKRFSIIHLYTHEFVAMIGSMRHYRAESLQHVSIFFGLFVSGCTASACMDVHRSMPMVPFWLSGGVHGQLFNRRGLVVWAEILWDSQRLSCIFSVNAQLPLRFSPMRSPHKTHTQTQTALANTFHLQ